MNFKYVKRKCGVRGCKNTDSFVISRNRELGNSLVLCKDCMKEALDAVKDYKIVPKTNVSRPAPPLFYEQPTAEQTVEPTTEQPTANVDTDKAEQTTEQTVETKADTEEKPNVKANTKALPRKNADKKGAKKA